MSDRVLRPKQVCTLLNISSVTLWRYRKNNLFPKHIKLGERIIGWRESVIMEWIKKKESDDKLKNISVLRFKLTDEKIMNLNASVPVKDFDFEVNRFWNSPKELPLRNVIGVVLNTPTFHDISVLCEKIGVAIIKHTLGNMIENKELKETQIAFCSKYINKYETEANA